MSLVPLATLNSRILPQLQKLKANGRDRWVSCCPAHEDKSPSFQIKLADDDRILMHCFAGCSIDDICASLGIEVTDLFPDDTVTRYPRLTENKRPNIPTTDTHFIAHFKNAVKGGYKPKQHEVDAYKQALARDSRVAQ